MIFVWFFCLIYLFMIEIKYGSNQTGKYGWMMTILSATCTIEFKCCIRSWQFSRVSLNQNFKMIIFWSRNCSFQTLTLICTNVNFTKDKFQKQIYIFPTKTCHKLVPILLSLVYDISIFARVWNKKNFTDESKIMEKPSVLW